MAASGFIGGVDLGGTKVLSVVVDENMSIVGRDLRPTLADEGPETVIARIVHSMAVARGGRRLEAVGIATPGPSDPWRGIVTTPPNLPGWKDVPLARLVGEALGVPAWLENDANAAALAEHRLGAGRGSRHMVLLTLGTGIGGGIVIDGRLYHGASGGAGEVGHQQLVPSGPVCGCGRRGCLEALASGRALAARAAAIVEREPDGVLARLVAESGGTANARLLASALEAGDASARAEVEEAGRFLGAGIANLVNILNPEKVVLGGNLRKLGKPYLGPARAVVGAEAFGQHRRDARIVEAELDEDAGAIGGALVALEGLSGER